MVVTDTWISMGQESEKQKRIAEFESKAVRERVPALVAKADHSGAVVTLVETVDGISRVDDLRELVTGVRERLQSETAVVALAAVIDDKPSVIIATTDASRAAGVKAGALAKVAAGVLGGGGGGRDDMAQCGGTDATAMASALEAIRASIAG